ncbi:MAG TPA: tRNA glutamyl-Q(34) synthetase GluQRS [Rhizomicrobium sp.]|nr:tRNA glutamyl-Q(34) synthetase GluQRS [Rhizomicrobium sp.]
MIVTRFAPSPTGLLHLGHAFAACTAADAGERFLLRIEDIDTTRVREEFVDAIYEDLSWLGLRWEEPVLRQSSRFNAYRTALAKLDEQELLYPCFCTRKEIAEEIARASEAPHGPEGPLYPGTCRHLSADERAARMESGASYALRLDGKKAARVAGALTFAEHDKMVAVEPLLFGDVVLARKETPASYHLAAVVDDAFQGVTLVTRGSDLLPATHVQRVLQALLGLPEPAYAHHRLILDAEGRKFSKRDKAVTLRALREAGQTPGDIRAMIGL